MHRGYHVSRQQGERLLVRRKRAEQGLDRQRVHQDELSTTQRKTQAFRPPGLQVIID